MSDVAKCVPFPAFNTCFNKVSSTPPVARVNIIDEVQTELQNGKGTGTLCCYAGQVLCWQYELPITCISHMNYDLDRACNYHDYPYLTIFQ